MSDIETPGAGSPGRKTDEERKRILADSIQRNVVQGGARVESQSDFQAVLVRGHRPNHVLHAILTIFTCLLWGIVWIVISLTGGEKRALITVDEYGNALVQQL